VIKLDERFVEKHEESPDTLSKTRLSFKFITYSVVVQDEGVRILVGIVERPLRNAIFDFDRTLYVQLIL
jgi:hypothetical protein